MHPDDLRKEAEDIEKEIAGTKEDVGRSRYIFKILGGLFLALLVILMVVPYYSVRIDPEPQKVMPLSFEYNFGNNTTHLGSVQESVLLGISPQIRQSAISIISDACPASETCYAKALFYYVRDNIQYVKDPEREYVQIPEETMLGAGDCEDKAILLDTLMKSIGIRSRVVLIPGHAYNEIYLKGARSKYNQKDGWIALDPTCTGCEFGQLPPGDASSQKSYVG